MATSSVLQQSILDAVSVLKRKGVVAFPTDTLYGLGADAFCVEAVGRVFEIKGRSGEMALPLLLGDIQDLDRVSTEISDLARGLVERFWPGSLTLILRKSPEVPNVVTGGRDSVAVRMPDHHVPLALARELGGPITGTSANRSGGPNPVTAEDVRSFLGQTPDYVVDGGPATSGLPSTVVDLTSATPRLVRPGAIPHELLKSVCSTLAEVH